MATSQKILVYESTGMPRLKIHTNRSLILINAVSVSQTTLLWGLLHLRHSWMFSQGSALGNTKSAMQCATFFKPDVVPKREAKIWPDLWCPALSNPSIINIQLPNTPTRGISLVSSVWVAYSPPSGGSLDISCYWALKKVTETFRKPSFESCRLYT